MALTNATQRVTSPGLAVGFRLFQSPRPQNYRKPEQNQENDQLKQVASGGNFPILSEVAIEYITALEGPFWRKIRGKGHAPEPQIRSASTLQRRPCKVQLRPQPRLGGREAHLLPPPGATACDSM